MKKAITNYFISYQGYNKDSLLISYGSTIIVLEDDEVNKFKENYSENIINIAKSNNSEVVNAHVLAFNEV